MDDEKALYYAFYELIEFDGGEPADDMILLRAEGRHRTAFIKKSALDYVSIPTIRSSRQRRSSRGAFRGLTQNQSKPETR